MSRPQKITIIDSTLREGQQNPEMHEHGKHSLTLSERIELFTVLVNYGIPYIEVFSPSVNRVEAKSLATLIKIRNKLVPAAKTKILAHVRCNEKDCSAAIKAGVDGLNLYMGTSQESINYNHGKLLSEVADQTYKLVKQLRRQHPQLELRFSGEDAFRTPVTDLFTVYDRLYGLVNRFGLPDTVGIATPKEVKKRIRILRRRYPKVGLEGHFHNDRGMALINSLSAIDAGLDYIDTSLLGLGERSGITSTTGLVFNLFLDKPALVNHFNLIDSYSINVITANIMRMQVPYTEPVSLTNATHSAGVHTSAMLKNNQTYQAHPLKVFGVDQTRLLLGPLSGWHVVDYYLTHVLNFLDVTETMARQITEIFKNRFDQSGRHLRPTQILAQIASELNLKQKEKPLTHIEDI